MTWECTWPRGCSQPISLVDGEGRERELSHYHWKILVGLIEPQFHGFVSKSVSKAQVVSDEQVSIAQALEQLGADPKVIQRAFTKGAEPNGATAWQRLLYREPA